MRIRTIVTLALTLAIAAPAAAQTWPPRLQEIVDQLAMQHPTWVADDTGPRGQLNQLIAEQAVCDLGPLYGLKRSAAGTLATDVIAQAMPFIGWDWEVAHNGEWLRFPPAINLAGQAFVPVACVNHLASKPPATGPTEPPIMPPPVIVAGPTLEDIKKAIAEDGDKTRTEITNARGDLARIGMFIVKYIAPAAASAYAAWQVAKP